MQLYSPIIIKFALGIVCLIIQINIMGKGNLAPSSAMDQVQNYVLGGIIGGVIYNDSITVLQFVLVLIIWTLKLRSNGIYEVQNVKRAILEQNGQLTIIEFGGENIKYPIIVDGQANYDVLDIINKNEEWLETKILENGFNKITEVYLGEYISGELKLYGYQE